MLNSGLIVCSFMKGRVGTAKRLQGAFSFDRLPMADRVDSHASATGRRTFKNCLLVLLLNSTTLSSCKVSPFWPPPHKRN